MNCIDGHAATGNPFSRSDNDFSRGIHRLVFLTSVFPSPWLPTKGTFNFELARAVAHHHQVRVINPISWVDEWQARQGGADRLCGRRWEQRDGILIEYPRYYYPPKLGRVHYDRFLEWSLAGKPRQQIRDFHPEAIIGYWTHPDGTVAVRWARELHASAWVIVGGSDILLVAEEPRRARKMRETLRAADGVLVLSEPLRERLLEWGLEPQRVHVFRRGIDRQRFSSGSQREARQHLGLPADRRVLVWIGRMVPVKGLDVLLDAAAMVASQGIDFHLVLVGDGPLRASLERRAVSDGVQARVQFAGARPHEELAEWYRAADWTVLSSHSEGVPNVLLESRACGTPFVSTRVGGVAEIASPGSDLLAEAGSVASLADQLQAALAQPSLDEATRRRLAATVPSLEESADSLVRHIFPS